MKDFDKEIEELELKLRVLKDEKKIYDQMMPNIKLAELIHSKICNDSHTDECSWKYEKWDGLGIKTTRQLYLDKANIILKKVSYKDAEFVIRNL